MNAVSERAVEVRIREEAAGTVGACTSEIVGGERDFPVTVIREGLALSGRYYARQAVEDVARLVNGARAFANHPTPSEDRERPVRAIGDVVGVYRDVRVEEVEDPSPVVPAASPS